MQSVITSNNDGTYLLTLSSSLAAEYLVTLKLGDRAVGSASVAVAPRTADAARSLVISTDFGVLDPEAVLKLTAGRSYEFGALLFDNFGNKAVVDRSQGVFGVDVTDGSGGSAGIVRNLDQHTARYINASSHIALHIVSYSPQLSM